MFSIIGCMKPWCSRSNRRSRRECSWGFRWKSRCMLCSGRKLSAAKQAPASPAAEPYFTHKKLEFLDDVEQILYSDLNSPPNHACCDGERPSISAARSSLFFMLNLLQVGRGDLLGSRFNGFAIRDMLKQREINSNFLAYEPRSQDPAVERALPY